MPALAAKAASERPLRSPDFTAYKNSGGCGEREGSTSSIAANKGLNDTVKRRMRIFFDNELSECFNLGLTYNVYCNQKLRIVANEGFSSKYKVF